MTCKARWHEKGAALRPPESRAYTPAPPIAVGSPRCSPSLCTCCKAPRSLAVRLLGAFHWRKGRRDSYCSSCTSARCRCLSRGHTWACRLLPKSSSTCWAKLCAPGFAASAIALPLPLAPKLARTVTPAMGSCTRTELVAARTSSRPKAPHLQALSWQLLTEQQDYMAQCSGPCRQPQGSST